jgi:hypothetical protein
MLFCSREQMQNMVREVSAAPVEGYVRDPAIHCTELESIIESQSMAVLMDRVGGSMLPVKWATEFVIGRGIAVAVFRLEIRFLFVQNTMTGFFSGRHCKR